MFARHFTLVLVALTLVFAARLSADEVAYQKALSSTCFIVSPIDKNSFEIGTGVLIDATHAVTAAHVVGNAKTVLLYAPVMNDKGRPITDRSFYLKNAAKYAVSVKVVAKNDKTDVAIVQLPYTPRGMTVATFAAKGAMPGQTIFAIGNSGDIDDGLWRYRDGSVRQACFKKMDDVQAEVIQTTIPSDGGDSGGPVFNSNVELVGITHGHKGQTGYCIDICEITKLLSQVPSARPVIASNTTKPVGGTTPAAPFKPYDWPITNNTTPKPIDWNAISGGNTWNKTPATPTMPAAPVVTASIDGCRVVHNVQLNSAPGMDLHLKTTLINARGHDCEVVISLRDENGDWVRDANGQVIQIVRVITPGYDETTYGHVRDNLVIFFPYAKIDLHLGRGAKNYGFAVSIWDRQTNGWITPAGYPVNALER